MAKYTKISFKKDELNLELARIFKEFMEKNFVHAILVPANQSSGVVKQTLFVDPAKYHFPIICVAPFASQHP